MNESTLGIESVFSAIAFACVFYIKAFEDFLYMGMRTFPAGFQTFLFGAYEFAAIPLFYFSLAAFAAAVVLKRSGRKTSPAVCKFMKVVFIIALIAYIVLAIGIFTMPDRLRPISFFSVYAWYFIAAGVVFVLSRKNKEDNGG